MKRAGGVEEISGEGSDRRGRDALFEFRIVDLPRKPSAGKILTKME